MATRPDEETIAASLSRRLQHGTDPDDLTPLLCGQNSLYAVVDLVRNLAIEADGDARGATKAAGVPGHVPLTAASRETTTREGGRPPRVARVAGRKSDGEANPVGKDSATTTRTDAGIATFARWSPALREAIASVDAERGYAMSDEDLAAVAARERAVSQALDLLPAAERRVARLIAEELERIAAAVEPHSAKLAQFLRANEPDRYEDV